VKRFDLKLSLSGVSSLSVLFLANFGFDFLELEARVRIAYFSLLFLFFLFLFFLFLFLVPLLSPLLSLHLGPKHFPNCHALLEYRSNIQMSH
jgi:hypothetical protein